MISLQECNILFPFIHARTSGYLREMGVEGKEHNLIHFLALEAFDNFFCHWMPIPHSDVDLRGKSLFRERFFEPECLQLRLSKNGRPTPNFLVQFLDLRCAAR